MSEEVTHDDRVVVIDVGTSCIRFGLNDSTGPAFTLPCVIGREKQRAHVGMQNIANTFFGNDALTKRAVCNLSYPVRVGAVERWDDMELLFRHAYSTLDINPAQYPAIVTESCNSESQHRGDMGKLMLGSLRVPGIHFAAQGVMGLFAAGRTSGIVVDSGEGATHSLAVCNGIALPKCRMTNEIGGQFLTEDLVQLLRAGSNAYAKDYAKQVKEKLAYVCADFDEEMSIPDMTELQREYLLPDGQCISLCKERFVCAEVIFKPRMRYPRSNYADIASTVAGSILCCEEALRPLMMSNITLMGGTTMLPGYGTRIENELNLHNSLQKFARKRRITVSDNSKFVVSPAEMNWQGAAILSRLSSWKDVVVTQDAWKDGGVAALSRHRLGEYDQR